MKPYVPQRFPPSTFDRLRFPMCRPEGQKFDVTRFESHRYPRFRCCRDGRVPASVLLWSVGPAGLFVCCAFGGDSSPTVLILLAERISGPGHQENCALPDGSPAVGVGTGIPSPVTRSSSPVSTGAVVIVDPPEQRTDRSSKHRHPTGTTAPGMRSPAAGLRCLL